MRLENVICREWPEENGLNCLQIKFGCRIDDIVLITKAAVHLGISRVASQHAAAVDQVRYEMSRRIIVEVEAVLAIARNIHIL
ncbi:hypothetical protein [Paraburkholderia sp. WC7.3g]|uniref:hypothetical protein n=1 Tax=Paraburkholderia sp. WC7.3g TaxID=2991070 RepID=UPI003D1916ED